ncbi:MAG: hypothetical protein J5757_08175 [Lachnospiraceae bacterium]|nr:hypothetical protein [Lachnospiraceae bacterium]
MRRSKKLAAVSMSAMLALSSMAGCTKKDAGDETTQATVATQPDTTADVQTTTAAPADTTAAAVQENNTDASGEKANATEPDKATEAPTEEKTEAPTEEKTEAPTEEETEAPTKEVDPGSIYQIKTNDALAKLLDQVSDAKQQSSKVEISVDLGDMLAGQVGLTGVKADFVIDSFIDLDAMKASGTVGVDLNAKELKVDGDLIRFALAQDYSAINIDAVALVSKVFGSEEALSALLQGTGLPITTNDIKKMTSVKIPMGTNVVDFKALDGDALAFAKDYAKRILGDLDARSITSDGKKVVITPDGALVASIARSVIVNSTEGDIDKLFEILPQVMPTLNEKNFEAGMKAVVDEIEKGFKTAGMDTSSLGLDDISGQIEEIKDQINDALGDMLENTDEAKAKLKASLNEFKEKFAEVSTEEEYNEAIDEVNEAIKSVFPDGLPKIVIEADANGMKVSFEGEMPIPEAVAEDAGSVKFSVKATFENNKGKFEDVKDASDLSEVVAAILNVVKTYEAMQGQGGASSLSGLEGLFGN